MGSGAADGLLQLGGRAGHLAQGTANEWREEADDEPAV